MKTIPKLNNTYNCFDDGKISLSRMYSVTVIDIIPYDKAEDYILDLWRHDRYDFPNLYAQNTDYFIRCLGGWGDVNEIATYARATDGGWFGLGYWAGKLDIDGSLTKIAKGIVT